jgi:hypothetical protein
MALSILTEIQQLGPEVHSSPLFRIPVFLQAPILDIKLIVLCFTARAIVYSLVALNTDLGVQNYAEQLV